MNLINPELVCLSRTEQIDSLQDWSLHFLSRVSVRRFRMTQDNSQHPRSIQIKTIPFRSNLLLSRLFCLGHSNLRLPRDMKENIEISMVTNQYRTGQNFSELLNHFRTCLFKPNQILTPKFEGFRFHNSKSIQNRTAQFLSDQLMSNHSRSAEVKY